MPWEQLTSILEARQEKDLPPSACPNDGELLVPGVGDSLVCRFDAWQWPRDLNFPERSRV